MKDPRLRRRDKLKRRSFLVFLAALFVLSILDMTPALISHSVSTGPWSFSKVDACQCYQHASSPTETQTSHVSKSPGCDFGNQEIASSSLSKEFDHGLSRENFFDNQPRFFSEIAIRNVSFLLIRPLDRPPKQTLSF